MTTQLQTMERSGVYLDLINLDAMFVLLSNGVVVPIVDTIDGEGDPTCDRASVEVVVYGNDTLGFACSKIDKSGRLRYLH